MLLNYHIDRFVGYYSNPTAPNVQNTTKKNKTTNVIIQQHSRKLLMMDILMSVTC